MAIASPFPDVKIPTRRCHGSTLMSLKRAR